MTTQTLTWTALPYGGRRGAADKVSRTGRPLTYKPGTLLLSVHLAPRLVPSNPETLRSFSDFMSADGTSGWPQTLAGLKFRVETSTGENPMHSVVVSSAGAGNVETALWTRLFNPVTLVRPFDDEPPIDKRRLVSYSVKPIADLITGQYTAVAKKPSLFYKLPTVDKLVTANPTLAAIAASLVAGQTTPAALPPIADSIPPDSITATRLLVKPSSSVTSFERFHRPFPTYFDAQPELPEFDFHTAIASLANYPALLRKLGLIVDIRISETLVRGMSRIRVVPVWPSGVAPSSGHGQDIMNEDKSPWVHFDLNWARPAAPFLPKPRVRAPQIRDGELIVKKPSAAMPAPVSIIGFDVDMAAQKLKSLSQDVLVNLRSNIVVHAEERGTAAASGTVEFAPRDTSTGLPPLRTIGPSLLLNGAAASLGATLDRVKALNALLGEADDGRTIVLDAEDVTQGWRVDAWDSDSGKWYGLCARKGTYSIADQAVTWDGNSSLIDEGWVEESGVMEYGNTVRDKGTSDVKVHEQMFCWDGWSLVVARPGKPILDGADAQGNARFPADDGTVTDAKGTYKLGQYVDPKFPLMAAFSVPPLALPMLRFGTGYRFRVRAVDMAGNSVPFQQTDTDFARLGVTAEVVHRRYEPLPPPVNLPKTAMGPGESVDEIVLRSSDGVMAVPAERHVVPPRCGQTLAEQHGGFDLLAPHTVNGKKTTLRAVDPNGYEIIKKHQGDLPTVGPASAIESVPYLPEVIASGASLQGLPGVPIVTKRADKHAGAGSALTFSNTTLTDGSKTVSLTVTRVSWQGGTWYDPKPFVLRVQGIEALDTRVTKHAKPAAPKWDATTRTLTIQLAKAEKITVQLSSFVTAGSHLRQLALVDLGTKGLSARSATRLTIERTTVVGVNWAVTPSHSIVLTHAVERPLIAPDAVFYPHRSANTTWASLTTNATLKIHGKSTRRIDVFGRWTDFVDDPSADSSDPAVAPIFEYPRDPRLIFSVDVQTDSTSAINSASNPKTRHYFGDTRRRKVKYHAVATTRFRDYFATAPADPADRFTLAGSEVEVDIPATARPTPPLVAYCMPSFKRVSATNSKQRLGGVRVYLERPWFSSGEGERLGVVFLEPKYLGLNAMTNTADFARVRPWVSEWGHDPIWTSGTLPKDFIRASSFSGATINTGVALAENTGGPLVSVASFPVEFDNELKRWFADVRLDIGAAYTPFVRLAVCRWQPWTVVGLNNSEIVMCDFIQQMPDRTFAVSYTPTATAATVTLSGPTYVSGSVVHEFAGDTTTPIGRSASAYVERRKSTNDLDWEAVPGNYSVTLAPPATYDPGPAVGLILGTLPLPPREAGYEYRVQIREHERHSTAEKTTSTALRLVFVETLPLWGGAIL